MIPYRLPKAILARTFANFRTCGRGHDECQVLWTGPWHSPDLIAEAVHPKHAAHFGGFVVDDRWLHSFWLDQGKKNSGIRVQVHTHPGEAFHSETDDRFPIIHKPGFLSLVIPNFGLGPIGFDDAYLTEIQSDGRWQQIPIETRLVLI